MVAEQIRQEVAVSFEDMGVLEGDSGIETFILDWNWEVAPPPFYVAVDARRFSYTGETLLVKGHGAKFGRVVQEHASAGRLVIFVERAGRLLVYVHDPAVTDDGDDE
ncbi:MAG: hypothetical protein EXR66_04200 [Dehalococcoidia bacterium]|nr:hypothetical protein [Dehalococcoidia bacterium]